MMEYYAIYVFGAILLSIILLILNNGVNILSTLSIISLPLILGYYLTKTFDRTSEISDFSDNTRTDLNNNSKIQLSAADAIRILDYKWEPSNTGPKDYLSVKPYYDEKILERGGTPFPELMTSPQTYHNDVYNKLLGKPDFIEAENSLYEKAVYNPTATDLITYYGNLGSYFES